MQSEYRTIAAEASAEIEEKKSRFIGVILPVRTEEEVTRHLEELRKEHYKARHLCFAYILGEQGKNKRASDDGEPSGTAGRPILSVLEGYELTNTLLVVIRYFGGILLGTGGLVRAYTEAAREAVQSSSPVVMSFCEKMQITISYSVLDKVLYHLRQDRVEFEEPKYGQEVVIVLILRAERVSGMEEKLQQLTQGTVLIQHGERGFLPLTI